MNKNFKSVVCLILVLVMVLSFAGCKRGEVLEPTGEKVTYTVRIVNQADKALANVGVYIYEDSTQKELVWYDVTNEAGEMTFTDVQRSTYVAVLADVPTGYAVEEYYPLTSLNTEIRLAAGTMTGEEEITYNLGDLMMDFTFTATDGKEYSLHGLLEEKQAVILNFYYNGCVPCQMEFPYLQEAYEEYAEQVAVVAMSPMDDNEAVTAFQKEHNLGFLMAAVGENWQNIMQIKAYPTTFVIDRLGNIVLIHSGSIDSAQTFKDVFAAVTGDDYEQKIYQNITEIETTAQTGTINNPTLMGATPKFELTIEGGKEHYIEFLKLNNLTMQIKDPDIYVIYNDKTYKPVNGVVSLLVTCPDMNTPVTIVFGNSSEETKTFTVTMAAQPGSIDNPYSLKEGENKVRVNAGNEQGVYHLWTAKENGALRVWCTSATKGVKYDCALYNLTSYAQRNMGEEGKVDENGNRYVEVLVNKGDQVQMIAAVLPDESWNYPSGNFTYQVKFIAGAGRDQEKEDKTTYTVTVTDEEGQPLPNVNFHTLVDEVATSFATKADGVATVELPTNTYKVTMIIPEGYTSEVTEFELTKENPNYTLKLKKKVVVMKDYTVSVVDANEAPLANVTVIIGSQFATTDEQGKAVFKLEQGQYTVKIATPDGFAAAEESYSFPENETALTIALEYALGTEKNPIDIYEMEVTTDPIQAGKGLYYNLYRLAGLTLTIDDADAKITIGDQVYTANEDGKVVLTVPASGGTMTPVLMKLENTGEETELYNIVLEYPLGHRMNPQILENLGELTTDLVLGSTGGYYYSWTTAEEGVVTFYLKSTPTGVPYDLVLTNTTNSVVRLLSENGEGGFVTLNVSAGDTILINPTVMGAVNQPIQFVSVGSFTAQENTDDVKYIYSVIVKDAEGNPMENMAVTIGNTQLTTDENGLAFAQLVDGTYTAKITVPAGYKASATQATLTAVENQVQFVLTAVTMVDYTVNVTLDDAAYTDQTKVQILENGAPVFEQITTTGTVTANLPEGNYTVKLTMLENNKLLYNAETAKLTAANPTLDIALTRPKTYTDYKITVLDASGKAMRGLLVQIMNGTTVMASGNTDANGLYVVNLETGNYTVELKFSGTTYYYNRQSAVLNGNAAVLTIRLASEVNAANTETHWMINEQKMYKLSVGTTHVELGAGKAYTYVDGEEAYCLFAFAPTQLGVYSVGIDYPGLEIRQYGTVIGNVIASSTEFEDGTLHYEIKEKSQLGNVYLMFGVQNKDGVTDACVTITRIGEPGFSMEDLPENQDWYSGYVPTQQSTPSGKLKYIDIKASTDSYNIYYDATDKEYKIMVNGVAKTLYMNLGTVTTQNMSINQVVNGDGVAGGSALRKYITDSNGNIISKEEYTDVIREYISKADTKYGVYRVTKDLAYMIQNAKPGWWDVTSADYRLQGCNPELGWLFACCYIQ